MHSHHWVHSHPHSLSSLFFFVQFLHPMFMGDLHIAVPLFASCFSYHTRGISPFDGILVAISLLGFLLLKLQFPLCWAIYTIPQSPFSPTSGVTLLQLIISFWLYLLLIHSLLLLPNCPPMFLTIHSLIECLPLWMDLNKGCRMSTSMQWWT